VDPEEVIVDESAALVSSAGHPRLAVAASSFPLLFRTPPLTFEASIRVASHIDIALAHISIDEKLISSRSVFFFRLRKQ